jgi:hypothetical protein
MLNKYLQINLIIILLSFFYFNLARAMELEEPESKKKCKRDYIEKENEKAAKELQFQEYAKSYQTNIDEQKRLLEELRKDKSTYKNLPNDMNKQIAFNLDNNVRELEFDHCDLSINNLVNILKTNNNFFRTLRLIHTPLSTKDIENLVDYLIEPTSCIENLSILDCDISNDLDLIPVILSDSALLQEFELKDNIPENKIHYIIDHIGNHIKKISITFNNNNEISADCVIELVNKIKSKTHLKQIAFLEIPINEQDIENIKYAINPEGIPNIDFKPYYTDKCLCNITINNS